MHLFIDLRTCAAYLLKCPLHFLGHAVRHVFFRASTFILSHDAGQFFSHSAMAAFLQSAFIAASTFAETVPAWKQMIPKASKQPLRIFDMAHTLSSKL